MIKFNWKPKNHHKVLLNIYSDKQSHNLSHLDIFYFQIGYDLKKLIPLSIPPKVIEFKRDYLISRIWICRIWLPFIYCHFRIKK